jgi:hypothetical protein
VGADLRAFLEEADRKLAARFRRKLLEADRRGEAGGPPPTITTSYSIASRATMLILFRCGGSSGA